MSVQGTPPLVGATRDLLVLKADWDVKLRARPRRGTLTMFLFWPRWQSAEAEAAPAHALAAVRFEADGITDQVVRRGQKVVEATLVMAALDFLGVGPVPP
ncbi:hypothetical protein GGF32_001390 [Allomyces javanicus]|nr:hypothetical protein GGF32_001390 [Allomyces javanicus]